MEATHRSALLVLAAAVALTLLVSLRGPLLRPASAGPADQHGPISAGPLLRPASAGPADQHGPSSEGLAVLAGPQGASADPIGSAFLPLVSGSPPYSAALIDGPWAGLPTGAGAGLALDSERGALTLRTDPTRLAFVARPDASTSGYANSVWELGSWNGRVYLGYGDSWNNRGPVDIVSYDPRSGVLTSEMPDIPEEQVGGWFAGVDGRFYASGIDAQESWTFGNLYVNDGLGWIKLRTIPRGVHVYRVVEFPGRLFADYAANDSSSSPDIYALVSDNLGASWSEERVDANPGPRAMVIDNLELVFHKTGPKLYAVYVMDQDSPDEVRRLYSYDGHIWRRVLISDPSGEFRPQRVFAFGSRALVAGYVRNVQTGYRRNAVYALDGQTQREVGFLQGRYMQWEYCGANAGSLYCILQNPWTGDPVTGYTLYRTADLNTWETVSSVKLMPGAVPRSLAFSAERLFVGATNGGWQEINPGVIELSPALVYTIENATLEWDADLPEGTAISFRLRSSANDYGQLMSKPFVGPDGTFGTAFEASGQPLNASHNGDTLLQITVHRARTGDGPWPVVRSVTLRGSRGSVTFAVDEGTGLYAAVNLHASALYTSTVYRLQEPISSGSLSWTATVPPSTTLRFQVRSASRDGQLPGQPFVGPDGTPATYYESSGLPLWAGHDGGLVLQYRAELASTNPVLAPTLRQVVLLTRSDRLHHFSIGTYDSVPWVAGEPHPITVTAHLADGGLSPISGVVALSAKGSARPDPLAIQPTELSLVRGTGAASVVFQTARRPLLCVTLGHLSSCSDSFQVAPGTVPVAIAVTTSLSTPLANGTPGGYAGQAFALSLTVIDRYRNQVRNYAGTVRCDLWWRTAGSQVLAPYTFQREDSGRHDFAVTVGESGEWNLVCADVANPRLAGSVTMLMLAP